MTFLLTVDVVCMCICVCGFDFGKSMIDKCGNDGIEYLERRIDEARIFGSFNDFDLGIIDAIQQHRQSSVA